MPPGAYGATTQSTARNAGPPTLETARLVLRAFEVRDVEDVFTYASDAEVSRYVLWDRHTTRADSQRFLEWVLGQYARGELPSWGIVDKASGRVVGSIGYGWPEPAHARAEVGYVLARSHWGRGLMSEAVSAVLAHAFRTLHLHKVVAHCHVLNVGSRRVLEKVGLRHEGRLYEHLFVKGSYWDIDVLGVLDREWAERDGKAPR